MKIYFLPQVPQYELDQIQIDVLPQVPQYELDQIQIDFLPQVLQYELDHIQMYNFKRNYIRFLAETLIKLLGLKFPSSELVTIKPLYENKSTKFSAKYAKRR